MKEIETIKEIRTLKDELKSQKAKEEEMKSKYIDKILEEEVERKFRENVPSDLGKLHLLARKKNYMYLILLIIGVLLALSTIITWFLTSEKQIPRLVLLILIGVGIALFVIGIKIAGNRSENKAFQEEYKKLKDYENISITDHHLVIDGHHVMNLSAYTTYRKDQKFYNPLEKKMLSKSYIEKMKFIQERPLLAKKLSERLDPIKKEVTSIELKIKELSDSISIPESFLDTVNSDIFFNTIMEASEEFKNIHKFSELLQKILDILQENRSKNYESKIENKTSIIEIVKTTNEFLDNKYIPCFLK